MSEHPKQNNPQPLPPRDSRPPVPAPLDRVDDPGFLVLKLPNVHFGAKPLDDPGVQGPAVGPDQLGFEELKVGLDQLAPAAAVPHLPLPVAERVVRDVVDDKLGGNAVIPYRPRPFPPPPPLGPPSPPTPACPPRSG